MNLASRLMASGASLGMVYAVGLALTFARNLILARMLGPEQFGIALTYAVVMGFLEASFAFGPSRYILHSPDGDTPEVVGAAHTLTIASRAASGLTLFLIAGPLASLFHAPNIAWAYKILAILIVIHGFENLYYSVAQRTHVYKPLIIILIGANAAGFFSGVIAALIDPTHVAMLISMAAYVATLTILSFATAAIPYRLYFGLVVVKKLMKFGWPLIVSSLLAVLVAQGDRAIAGTAFGPDILAVYSTAAILVGAPTVIALRVLGATMLPVLGPLRGQPLFKDRYESFGAIVCLYVLSMHLPVAILGARIIPLLFGRDYDPDPTIVALLAAASGIRLLRGWANLGALAVGNSKATLFADMVQGTSLLLAGIAVYLGLGLQAIAVGMVAGEVAALIFAVLRSNFINNSAMITESEFLGPTIAALIGAIVFSYIVNGSTWATAVLMTVGLQGAAFLSLLIFSCRVARTVSTAIGVLRKR